MFTSVRLRANMRLRMNARVHKHARARAHTRTHTRTHTHTHLRALADRGPVRVREVVEAAVAVTALLYLSQRLGVVGPAVGAHNALVGGEPAQEHEQDDAAGPDVGALVVGLTSVTFLQWVKEAVGTWRAIISGAM